MTNTTSSQKRLAYALKRKGGNIPEFGTKEGEEAEKAASCVVNASNDVIIKAENNVSEHHLTGENDREIIDKATYHKLTNPVIQKGGMIITALDENGWIDYLNKQGTNAVTLENMIIFRQDATTTEVLEEVYHFNQNCSLLNNQLQVSRE